MVQKTETIISNLSKLLPLDCGVTSADTIILQRVLSWTSYVVPMGAHVTVGTVDPSPFWSSRFVFATSSICLPACLGLISLHMIYFTTSV